MVFAATLYVTMFQDVTSAIPAFLPMECEYYLFATLFNGTRLLAILFNSMLLAIQFNRMRPFSTLFNSNASWQPSSIKYDYWKPLQHIESVLATRFNGMRLRATRLTFLRTYCKSLKFRWQGCPNCHRPCQLTLCKWLENFQLFLWLFPEDCLNP